MEAVNLCYVLIVWTNCPVFIQAKGIQNQQTINPYTVLTFSAFLSKNRILLIVNPHICLPAFHLILLSRHIYLWQTMLQHSQANTGEPLPSQPGIGCLEYLLSVCIVKDRGEVGMRVYSDERLSVKIYEGDGDSNPLEAMVLCCTWLTSRFFFVLFYSLIQCPLISQLYVGLTVRPQLYRDLKKMMSGSYIAFVKVKVFAF